MHEEEIAWSHLRDFCLFLGTPKIDINNKDNNQSHANVINTKQKRELLAKVSRNLYLMKGYYGARRELQHWPEGKFISVTRKVGGVAREKEGRKNQENRKCVYGDELENRETRGPSKVRKFFISCSPLSFISTKQKCTSAWLQEKLIYKGAFARLSLRENCDHSVNPVCEFASK